MKAKLPDLGKEEIYLKKFAHFWTKTFENILNDKTVAIKYAKIGLAKTGNFNPTEKTIEEHAKIMQAVAKIILDKRMKKTKKSSKRKIN